MTIEEFKAKIKEMCSEIPDNMNILIIIHEDGNKSEGTFFGIGCPACAMEIGMAMMLDGMIKHHPINPSGTTH